MTTVLAIALIIYTALYSLKLYATLITYYRIYCTKSVDIDDLKPIIKNSKTLHLTLIEHIVVITMFILIIIQLF